MGPSKKVIYHLLSGWSVGYLWLDLLTVKNIEAHFLHTENDSELWSILINFSVSAFLNQHHTMSRQWLKAFDTDLMVYFLQQQQQQVIMQIQC